MRFTYEIKYGDFGICYVVAPSFGAAETAFRNKNGNDYIITGIRAVMETKEPLFV